MLIVSMTTLIETERLILREYVDADAEAFLRLNSDPEVLRYTGDASLLSVQHALEVLCTHPIEDYRNYGFGRWACIRKDSDQQIGYIGLKYLPELDEVELGFRLERAHWGLVLATEGSLACIRYGFEKLGLNSIIGLAIPENLASVGVLKKCGLKLAGLMPYRSSDVAKYVIAAPGSGTAS